MVKNGLIISLYFCIKFCLSGYNEQRKSTVER